MVPTAFNDYALSLGRKSLKRIKTPENAAKVSAALHSWLDATPATLGQKLERVSGGFSSYGLNHFAVACYLCGASHASAETIDALHGEIEATPWSWIAKGIRERVNPAFVHDRIKREVVGASSRR